MLDRHAKEIQQAFSVITPASIRIRKLKITLQQAAVPPLAGFPVRNFSRSIIRSLTPQQAAGNALAIAVQFIAILIRVSCTR